MPCERAHAMFLHALIVVCAVCSASAPRPQVLLLGRLLAAPSETTAVVCWLRRARRRARRGVARARDSISGLVMGDPKHDALLSLVISYLCDRKRSTRRFRRSRDCRSGHDHALGACWCRSLHDRHTHPPPTATLSSKTVHNRMRNRRHDMAQRHSEPDGRVKPRIYSTPRTPRSNRARPL